MSTSTLDARIAAIDAKLDRGVTQSAVDGVTQAYDLDDLRRQRAELVRQRDRAARPRVSSMKLSNF